MTFGHRTALHRALELPSQVVVQADGPMFLDQEGHSAFARRFDVAGLQVWRARAVALGLSGSKRIHNFRKRGLRGLRHGAALAEGCAFRQTAVASAMPRFDCGGLMSSAACLARPVGMPSALGIDMDEPTAGHFGACTAAVRCCSALAACLLLRRRRCQAGASA